MTRDINLVVELQPDDAEGLATCFRDKCDHDVDTIRAAIARHSYST